MAVWQWKLHQGDGTNLCENHMIQILFQLFQVQSIVYICILLSHLTTSSEKEGVRVLRHDNFVEPNSRKILTQKWVHFRSKHHFSMLTKSYPKIEKTQTQSWEKFKVQKKSIIPPPPYLLKTRFAIPDPNSYLQKQLYIQGS